MRTLPCDDLLTYADFHGSSVHSGSGIKAPGQRPLVRLKAHEALGGAWYPLSMGQPVTQGRGVGGRSSVAEVLAAPARFGEAIGALGSHWRARREAIAGGTGKIVEAAFFPSSISMHIEIDKGNFFLRRCWGRNLLPCVI